jgi:hypothetical protein
MRTAREFPVSVAGDKAFPYAVMLQDYETLRNPNDKFVYIDIQNRQDVLEDLAKKRFEFLALRDDIRYILKHSDDFQNRDGTTVDRDKLSGQLDEVVNAINTMQHEASVCVRDAGKCAFTLFDANKFQLPVLAKNTEDLLIARGDAMVARDPLALLLRASLPDAESRRGFNIAFANNSEDTLPGPGKDRVRDALPLAERSGFNTAVAFFLMRNNAKSFAAKGAAIAEQVPALVDARNAAPDAFQKLGFDIATGIFGDPALGGQGDTAWGPGKQKIFDTLNAAAKLGFNASMHLHLGPPPLPRKA